MARPPMQPEDPTILDDYGDPARESYTVLDLVGRLIRTLDGRQLIRVGDGEVLEYLASRRWPR